MEYSQFLIFIVYFYNVESANILFVFDLPSPSHQIWNFALAEGLLEKGHNITMIGPDMVRRGEGWEDTYHFMPIEGIHESAHTEFQASDLVNMDPLSSMKMFYDFSYFVCNYSYHSESFRELMSYPEDYKFDIIIIDMTLSTCFYPLIQKFNHPPVVGVTAFSLPPFLSDTFGSGVYPAYLPFYQSRYTENMDFMQRTWNYFLTKLDSFTKQTYEMNQLEKLAENVFEKEYDFKKLERSISLLLPNHSPELHGIQPLTPNIIPVGGLHVKPDDTLPNILEMIFDNAGRGFIYFALGTNVHPHQFSKKKRTAILDAFSKMTNQTVIWKYDGILKASEQPENVIVHKWLPQNAVLAHPNIKLFITHGGCLSMQEAAYHGVPVIGIPFFGDQHLNVLKIAERKLGLKLDFEDLTSETLFTAMTEILNNPIYTNNMKAVSKRIKDQPQTPLERAVFWMEYVMRHNGTGFLNPKSRDMPYFVASSLDVELFLISILMGIVVVTLVLFIKCISLCCRKRTKTKVKTQ